MIKEIICKCGKELEVSYKRIFPSSNLYHPLPKSKCEYCKSYLPIWNEQSKRFGGIYFSKQFKEKTEQRSSETTPHLIHIATDATHNYAFWVDGGTSRFKGR